MDIKTLLSKKGWTGEEVGRALIANLIHEVKSKNEGKDSKPLFTQAEFERMESSLTGTGQFNFTSYGVFKDIFSSVVDSFNKGQGLYQQFYSGFYRILLTLEQAYSADKALADMERFPLIMTQSQYDRVRKAAQDKKRACKTSYRSIFFDMLGYYMGNYGEPIATPNDVKTAIEKTKNEPVTNKRILENWNKDMGEGYYTLNDGRRSDQMSDEEWKDALKKEFLSTHSLIIDGESASAEETASHFNFERILKGYKFIFEGVDCVRKSAEEMGLKISDGVTDEELMKQIEELASGLAISKGENNLQQLLDDNTLHPTRHVYTEPPANLTKHDVIDSSLDRYSGAYSDRLLDGVFVEEISEAAQFKEFIADYPDLYKALKEDIETRISKTKGLKPSQQSRKLFSWGELADLDIPVYKAITSITNTDIAEYYANAEYTGRETDTYEKRTRIWHKGIAIISDPNQFVLDKNGDYKEENNPLNEIMSIDNLANDSIRRRELNNCFNKLLKPALHWLYAYNALIDILTKAYAIEGLEHLKQDLSPLESQIEGLNGTLYRFYAIVYGDDKEKARKRALIRELFEPIYIDTLKPDPAVVAKMQEHISGLGFTAEARRQFSSFDAPIAALMEREA